ncbi:MAG: YqjF family protein [Gaiellaceae bacterium]
MLAAAGRQAASLRETAHRPWPLPPGRWVMGQTWEQLLFAHWPLPVDALRGPVPEGLELESHSGSAWLGVTPFRITGLRARGTMPLPWISTFPEINVRTYVRADEKPGIWFFSLDTSSRLGVEVARRWYRLPYFHARIEAEPAGDAVVYDSCRRDPRGHEAAFEGRYGPAGDAQPAAPGTLEHFLTERYCLYAADGGGGLHRAEIHHPPWPLQPGEAEIRCNTMPPPGVELPAVEPLLHFSACQDVVIWPLERLP